MAQPEGREEQKWSRAGPGLAPWAQSWGHCRLGVLSLKVGFAVALLWTARASINGSSLLIPMALGLVAQQAPQALKMQLFCYGSTSQGIQHGVRDCRLQGALPHWLERGGGCHRGWVGV